MKKVLFVTYEFPPKGGSGVQRGAKFVKYLPRFGWKPTVLSVADPPAALSDETLLGDIPPSVRVERAWSAEPTRLLAWARGLPSRRGSSSIERRPNVTGRARVSGLPVWAIRLIQGLFVPDEKIGWRRYAVREGLRAIARDGIDAIFASGPPATTYLVGERLARLSGLPLVVDFRDPWVSNAQLRAPTPLHAWAWRRLERRVVARASVVVSTLDAVSADFRTRYPDERPEKFVTITNGFDPSDFEIEPRRHDGFTITHTGVFYGIKGLNCFLDGLKAAIEEGGVEEGDVRVRLVGPYAPEVDRAVRSMGLGDIVESGEYLAHPDAVRSLVESDLLLLVLDSPGHSRTSLTGKLFEYIAAAKPVLAVIYEGETADLITRERIGTVVSPGRPEDVAAALGVFYRRYREEKPAVARSPDLLARFDRRRLTEKLAGVLDDVTRGGR